MMKKQGNIISRLYLILMMVFFYLPILYTVLFSFNSSKSLSKFSGFSLTWYENLFHNSDMVNSIYYTISVAVISTIISTIFGTITAIGLSKSGKAIKTAVSQINDLPILNPDIVTGIGLLMFFSSLAVSKGFTTMLLAHIMFCTPFVVLSVMPKLRSLDPNLLDAALDLGCTPIQALTKVIIPQITSGIVAGALIAFTMSFDDFIISYFVTGNGVSNISIMVYTMSKRINPTINALSTVVIAIILVGLILFNILPIIKSKLKGKKILSLSLAFVVLATGCIFVTLNGSSSSDKVSGFEGQTLKFYNTGEYVGENLISGFEEMYDCNVVTELFDSNEMMYTKLQAGDNYDVIVPSDYMVERLKKDNYLQPINKEQIPNLDNLTDGVKNLDFDSDNTYSVPYFWGTVGILYNKNVIPTEKIEKAGWEILRDTEYKGSLYMYDSERDSFMVALKALGYSMNTEDEKEINDAYNWLMDVNNTMEPSYVTDEVIDAMANGTKDLAVVYSGDAAYVLSENPDMGFYMPESGTNRWVDCMVIPANAENPALANEFINYVLSYEASYDNSVTVGYTSSNDYVLNDLASTEFDGNEAYLPRTDNPNDETFHDNEVLRKKLNELWTRVKSTK